MAHNAVELFAQFVYSLELSYDGLLERESELKATVAAILEQNGGQFVHFEEMGDTMRVQCAFTEYEEDVFQEICRDVAPLADGFVEARMLFVDKDMDCLYIYTISSGKWKECCLRLPESGPLGLAVREKNSM